MGGKPYTYNPAEMMANPKYAEQAQAMKEGFLGMSPMILGGAVGGYVRDRFSQKENSNDEDTKKNSAPNIDAFMRAIGNQESGGDYDAYNGLYGASGKYQILPENWAQWAKDAGLDENAPMTPENQEIVAKNKMLEYYKKFGDWRKVAEAWYGGEGAVDWSAKEKAARQAGGNPSLDEYADSVMAKYNDIISGQGAEEETSSVEITPEMIDSAKGKFWIEQGNVSYEGAQPQTMQSLYLLGKKFYELTGKPLVVSAVTNGSHADGEFSHGNGWKIDIHDGGSGAEGALFTDDFGEGNLLKEFVDYGHSLGLGMNVEGLGTGNVHIDVAVNGNQWIGEDAGTDYGGFKGVPSKKSRSTKSQAPIESNEKTTTAENYESPIDKIVSDLLKSVPDANLNFDSSKANPLEKSIYDAFVESKKNSEDDDTAKFVEFLTQNEMLKQDGTFKNSKANRAKLRQEFQEELDEYGQARINESKAKFFERQRDNDAKIISAFENFVQQEEDEGKPAAMKHRELLQNGQVGAMEELLKSAGIDFASGTVQTQEDATSTQGESPVTSTPATWKNFSLENQAKLVQNLKTELSSAGMLDENLGNALDNGNPQAVDDALKIFREWQKSKPINQILDSAPENLSDDAKKFRENYLQLQDNIKNLEAQRAYWQEQMKVAASGKDVYTYNRIKNIFSKLDSQLGTARAELEKLTPPTSFKKVSESEKLATEIQSLKHKLTGLSAQINDIGESTDTKSKRKLEQLKRQGATTYKKLLDAQDKFDALNDVGKKWREEPLDTNSAQDVIDLVQAGMAQTQNKINLAYSEIGGEKLSGNTKAAKKLASLGSQFAKLGSVMNAPVNPALNVSQALDEISKAREQLGSVITQISEIQSEEAVSAENEVDAANFMRESEELKTQAGNLFSFIKNLSQETNAAILEHAPKILTEVYGQRTSNQTSKPKAESKPESKPTPTAEPTPPPEIKSQPQIRTETPLQISAPQPNVREIFESNVEDLTDDAQKFRADFETLQSQIATLEDVREKALADNDALTHNDAQKQIDELKQQLQSLTPPSVINRNEQYQSDKKEIRAEVSRLNAERENLNGAIEQERQKYFSAINAGNQVEADAAVENLRAISARLEENKNSLNDAQASYARTINANRRGREYETSDIAGQIEGEVNQSLALEQANEELKALKSAGKANLKNLKSKDPQILLEARRTKENIDAQIADKKAEIERIEREIAKPKKETPAPPVQEEFRIKSADEINQRIGELERQREELQELKKSADTSKQIEAFRQLGNINKDLAELQKQASLSPLEKAKADLKSLNEELGRATKAISAAKKNGNAEAELAAYQKREELDAQIADKKAEIERIEEERRHPKFKPTIKSIVEPTAKTGKKVQGVGGKNTEVIADNGKPFKVRYKVVEATDLSVSHSLSGGFVNKNENYPAEFQPRDRERFAMQAQLSQMANNLRPADLMSSRNLNQGAPITRGDGVVLNGNGRTAAISHAYELGKADTYRKAVAEAAESFGLDRESVSKMKNPVLVRELVDELSVEDLKAINESKVGGSQIGSSEQAKIDAQKISLATLQKYVDNDEGDLTTAANREFVTEVLNEILSKDDLNAYTTKDGTPNKDAYARVKHALFALAYGDSNLLDTISESADNNIRQRRKLQPFNVGSQTEH